MAANPRSLDGPAGARSARLPLAQTDLAENRASGRGAARGPAVGALPQTGPRTAGGAGTHVCYIIDSDASIRQFLSLILQSSGLDTDAFADGHRLREALTHQIPDLVFLDVGHDSGNAAECIAALATANYRGLVQLTGHRGTGTVTQIKAIGDQQHLRMLPVLNKPFETSVIVNILQDEKLGQHTALAGRVDLGEALAKHWIEFWYQPKIDLRKKQLVGVEAFARARHPEHGVLSPEAFIPAATEVNLIALSEFALGEALKASINFAKIGASLRMAVNMPVNALRKVAIVDIVQSYRPRFDKWPGLLIDVTEEQVVNDFELARDIAGRLEPLNVKLAIDDFGRDYSAVMRLSDLPFAELKLDRSFVTGCGTDSASAPLCKAAIDLAHSFGSIAVGVGIERASDALALVGMGCDYGQGFLLGQPMPQERFVALLRQRATSAQARSLS
jgi:EAL domain-containing protein (putative c-di-GMP-specific phosphodiesterase class I)/ActR/RegA family two-component response regulator